MVTLVTAVTTAAHVEVVRAPIGPDRVTGP
jgi:hypothetical protein